MRKKLLMTPSEVVDFAFSTGEYVGQGAIHDSAIWAAQLRYMLPLLGEDLLNAVANGKYEQLREEYIAPTLGLLARIEAELDAYPPTTAERERSRLFLQSLTDYLNANAEEFEEYTTYNTSPTLDSILLKDKIYSSLCVS